MVSFTTGLLLDQGLPRSAVKLLQLRGAPCEHIAQIGMHAAEDSIVLAEAQRRGWAVVTLDADFHRLLAISGAATPSVIQLRLSRVDAKLLERLLLSVFERAAEDLKAGAVVTVTPNRIRVRRLPLR